MRNKTHLLFILFLFSVSYVTSGQKQVNSPYSRFNFGTLEPAGAFRSQGMGGISMGLRDNTSIFFTNPASYSSVDTTSFIFDFGLDYSYNKISSGSTTHSSDDMNFDHLMIGFPVARGIGIGAGVVPVSSSYYKLSDAMLPTDPDYDPLAGQYVSSHAGEGGLSQVFAGAGIRLHKYVSAGVNVNVLFGQISRTNQLAFTDQLNSYHDNSTERLNTRGINLDYGLQFTIPVRTKNFLNIGVSYTAGKRYKSDYDNYTFRYNSFGTADTILYASESGNAVRLPGTFRAGIAFGQTGKLTVGFDFIATDWSDSDIPGSEGYAADTKTYMFGLEYTPERYSNLSALRRMDYRLGGHFGNNYFVTTNGEQLKEAGISAGLGIPMRRGNLSEVNIFFDYTRKYGAGPLHTEQYLTAGISLNLYDFWFWKRQYD